MPFPSFFRPGGLGAGGWGGVCLKPLVGIAHKGFSQRNFILTGSPRTLSWACGIHLPNPSSPLTFPSLAKSSLPGFPQVGDL